MGKLLNICEKIEDKFSDVFFGRTPDEEEPKGKCSYTLSSVFPSVEIQEEVFKVLAESNKEEVSN